MTLHIVDELIHERAPKLVRSPAWPVVRPVLYTVLGRNKAVRMADAIAGMAGPEALTYVSNLLSLQVAARHLDRLPETGRCLMVCAAPAVRPGTSPRSAHVRMRPSPHVG